MPLWLQAGLWGLLGGSALLIGAGIGYFLRIPQRFIAAIMAFGAGVLISALSFELMDEAYKRGGLDSTSIGFLSGGTVYTFANWFLSVQGAKHRKRSDQEKSSEGGLAIAIGALLDGIPESIVIGVSMIEGGIVSWVTVAAVFLSNIPEGLSSAAGMKSAGRSLKYIFGVWGAIALLSGFAAFIGYSVFSGLSTEIIAATTAIAAGAILAMISDTMIPEAFAYTHDFAGIITVTGFLVAFVLSKL